MTLEQAILDAVRTLSPERQKVVLDHAKQLRDQSTEPRMPRQNGRGLWAEFNIDLSAEDIDEARREMWGNFPRMISDVRDRCGHARGSLVPY